MRGDGAGSERGRSAGRNRRGLLRTYAAEETRGHGRRSTLNLASRSSTPKWARKRARRRTGHRARSTTRFGSRRRRSKGGSTSQIPGVLSIDGELSRPEEKTSNSTARSTSPGRAATSASIGGTPPRVGKRRRGATCPEGCRRPEPEPLRIHQLSCSVTRRQTRRSSIPKGAWRPRDPLPGDAIGRTGRAVDLRGPGARMAAGRRGGGADVGSSWSRRAPASRSARTAEHPKSATVKPPAPFSGSAVYRSTGSIRSPTSGKLTGSLSVDIFGVKVRLAGPRAKASLINFHPASEPLALCCPQGYKGLRVGARRPAHAALHRFALGARGPSRRLV